MADYNQYAPKGLISDNLAFEGSAKWLEQIPPIKNWCHVGETRFVECKRSEKLLGSGLFLENKRHNTAP